MAWSPNNALCSCFWFITLKNSPTVKIRLVPVRCYRSLELFLTRSRGQQNSNCLEWTCINKRLKKNSNNINHKYHSAWEYFFLFVWMLMLLQVAVCKHLIVSPLSATSSIFVCSNSISASVQLCWMKGLHTHGARRGIMSNGIKSNAGTYCKWQHLLPWKWNVILKLNISSHMIEYKYFTSLRERDGEEKEWKKRKECGCLIKEE